MDTIARKHLNKIDRNIADLSPKETSRRRSSSHHTRLVFHIDIAEIQAADGKLYLFVAIGRTSKFAFVRLVERATRVTASAFLVALIAAVPYRVHTVPTNTASSSVTRRPTPAVQPPDT